MPTLEVQLPIDLDAVWAGPVHDQFLSSLTPTQIRSLWRLLLVATFADADFSDEQRTDLAKQLAESPGFDPAFDWEAADPEGDLAVLVAEYRANPDRVLGAIVVGLGDDASRRHAFRTTVELLRADGFVSTEEAFVADLGAKLGLEREVVDYAIQAARERNPPAD